MDPNTRVTGTEPSSTHFDYVAQTGSDAVAQATRDIRSALNSSVIDPITRNDLLSVQRTLDRLTPEQAARAFAGLTDAELATFTREINAWGPGAMGGLSAAEKQSLFNSAATQLDGTQLSRFARALDGADVVQLGEAIGDRATATTKAGFVTAMGGSDQITTGTRKDGNQTRAGTAETEATAVVLSSLRGSPLEFARAVRSLDGAELRAVIGAARGETSTDRMIGSGNRRFEADQLRDLQTVADQSWRDSSGLNAADTRLVREQAGRVQTVINESLAQARGAPVVLSDGSTLRPGIIPSLDAPNQAQRVAQNLADYQAGQQRIARLEALGTPEARQLAAELRRDYHAQEMAALAADAYHWVNPTDRTVPVGYTRGSELGDQQLARYGLTREMLAPTNSQFRAELYIPNADNPNPNAKPVLVFKGTTPNQPADWANNFTQGRGERTDYYDRAMQAAVRVNRASGGNVEFAGHSLGGGMASAASAATGRNATTFNSAGLHANTAPEFLRRNNLGGSALDAKALEGRITAYQVDGDILTGLQEQSRDIDPARADQLAGVVRFAAGTANNPFVQGQVEQRVGPIGNWGGLTNAQGRDLLNMPEGVGTQIELSAVNPNGSTLPPAAQFNGPNGIATRADAILDRLDARNAQARREADAIRDEGGFGAPVRAEAHFRARQIENLRQAWREYQADAVLQGAPAALNESVNRHMIYPSSLDARIRGLEARADALIGRR
jgi:hypothetical protein